MKNDEKLTKYRHGGDWAILLLVFLPMYPFKSFRRGKIQDVAEKWETFGSRRQRPTSSLLDAVEDDVAE